MRLLDLPDALRDEGVEPVVVDGFATRGSDFPDAPELHLVHWTAGPSTGVAPSLRTVTFGRGEPNPLPGPLCQVLQSRESGRSDRAYCVASGRANHAGVGEWRGVESGNTNGTGNEIEWSGPAEPFSPARREATVRIAAAFVRLQNSEPKFVCNHREYALPPGRKIDTNLDGALLRADVLDQLLGGDMFEAADRARLEKLEDLLELLVPRLPLHALTGGDDIGKVVPAGTAGSKPVADLWRYAVYLELERQGKTGALVGHIANAVVVALPPGQGGAAAPTLAEIQSAVKVIINQELGFLKPGT